MFFKSKALKLMDGYYYYANGTPKGQVYRLQNPKQGKKFEALTFNFIVGDSRFINLELTAFVEFREGTKSKVYYLNYTDGSPIEIPLSRLILPNLLTQKMMKNEEKLFFERNPHMLKEMKEYRIKYPENYI